MRCGCAPGAVLTTSARASLTRSDQLARPAPPLLARRPRAAETQVLPGQSLGAIALVAAWGEWPASCVASSAVEVRSPPSPSSHFTPFQPLYTPAPRHCCCTPPPLSPLVLIGHAAPHHPVLIGHAASLTPY